jgi:hypothetical protein
MWRYSRVDLTSSSISSPAGDLSSNLSADDTTLEAIKITPQTNDEADENTGSSDPDSVEGNDECEKEITPTEHADKLFAGMFSTQLKDKAARSERDSRQNQLQRGLWRTNSEGITYKGRQEYFKVQHIWKEEIALMSTQPERKEGMTYKGRQEYFKVQHIWKEEIALMSTQPERKAKMEKKRKEREWKDNLQVIEDIFLKPAKLLQKEKKQVLQMILDDKFPITDTAGETKEKLVSQISHLKYIPPQMRSFASTERLARRKASLLIKGYTMHVSAYFQGLTIDTKGKQYMVNKLNHMWVRDVFAEAFLYLGEENWKGKIVGKTKILG